MNNVSKSTPPSRGISDLVSRWANSNIETIDVAVVVDASKYSQRLVSVLPLCVQEDPDGINPAKPVVDECPVILQGNTDGVISVPLRKGDKVLIGYPKDSIEEFIYANNSDQYFQVDDMKFQGSQAVVLGAIGQPSTDVEVSPDNLEIRYFDCLISMSPSGEITVTNGAGVLTLQVSGDILANGATINTSGNVITALGSDVDEIRANLDSFRTAYMAHGTGAPGHPPPIPFVDS